jgi:hypothetical protein
VANFILHHDGAYNVWTTVADGCHYESAITIAELEDVIRFEQGQHGMDLLPARLARAHATGSSAIGGDLDECVMMLDAVHGGGLNREQFIAKYLTLTPTPKAPTP